MSMLDRAKALADELVRLRRDIHSHPELGFQEVRTAALVAETLGEVGGYRITTGVAKTGVVAEFGDTSGPTIAIRADMDALPIIEEPDVAYKSTNRGVMHACGHDAHTAILLGTAHLLREEFARQNLRGRVRLLFQPSEEAWDAEGKSGGLRMVEEGAMKDVDAVIALHVDSHSPSGKITSRSGWNTAAVDDFEGYIYASGGHGAYPHEATDPTFMLLPVLTALHGIRARRLNPMDPGVCSVGVIRAGNASNVIPSEVYVHGTLRSFSDEVRAKLAEEVERAFSIAKAMGGDYKVKIGRGYPAGLNDARVAGWLADVGREVVGEQLVDTEARAGMGAEDFAYMCQAAPGAMFNLGAAIGDGVSRGHHTPIFDIDERCMPIGAAVLAETAVRFLKGDLKL